MRMPPELKAEIEDKMRKLEVLGDPAFMPELPAIGRLTLFIEAQKEIILIQQRFINEH